MPGIDPSGYTPPPELSSTPKSDLEIMKEFQEARDNTLSESEARGRQEGYDSGWTGAVFQYNTWRDFPISDEVLAKIRAQFPHDDSKIDEYRQLFYTAYLFAYEETRTAAQADVAQCQAAGEAAGKDAFALGASRESCPVITTFPPPIDSKSDAVKAAYQEEYRKAFQKGFDAANAAADDAANAAADDAAFAAGSLVYKFITLQLIAANENKVEADTIIEEIQDQNALIKEAREWLAWLRKQKSDSKTIDTGTSPPY
jgi:hypothetical protein